MTTVTELLEGVARHKLSVDDFHRMAEAGILKCEDRVELIDGEIIDMTPIGSGHAGKTNRFAFAFARAAIEGRAVVSIQNPLRLDLYNEPEPDVVAAAKGFLRDKPSDSRQCIVACGGGRHLGRL